jgi:CTP synthase
MCGLEEGDVISAPNVESIYEVPVNFEKDKISERILEKLSLKAKVNDLNEWSTLVKNIKNAKEEVKIGIVGKYFGSGDYVLTDSYISVIESVKHAAYFCKRKPVIEWLDSDTYEDSPEKLSELKSYDGIIVPGGFGNRGVEGKIKVIEYCRKNKIPYFGLCYGMQLACIEFARNVVKLTDANTTEIDKKTKNPIIDLMPEQKILMKEKRYGGSMRLGAYPCKLIKGTKAYKAYGQENISERHRHRFEFNNNYREVLSSKGLIISGINADRDLVEIIELKDHPFFVGTQFHPEFKSRPLNSHPLFKEFIKAAVKNKL